MNITWKIFFSSVLTMTITFCTAGYILIFIFFESGYKQSVNSAIDLSSMFLQTFGNYMVNGQDGEEVEEAVGAIANNMLKENVRIYIEDEKGKSVYTDAAFEGKEQQLERGDAKGISYILTKEGTEYYIRVSNQIQVGDVWYYAWTDHNVTNLFTERENEIWIYNQFLVWIVLINGVISWTLARFIVHPIRKISQGAERIAGGDLDYRLSIRNHDEIGNMAINFNRMADSLAGEIAKLEDIAERQEEFIGSFAHELKTPLTSIIGYADLLRSNRQTEEERFIGANYIFQEGKRLENLSLRLLELTVLGKDEICCRQVDVSQLLKEMEGIMAPALEKQHIELVWETSEQRLSIEPELIKSVFFNLIDNARKALKSGGTIWVVGSREADGYVIEVKDNGTGIPKEKLDRITDAFYMVDKSRSRQQGGAGLGLSICKKIMELHGGGLLFESGLGQGTSVKMRFPVYDEPEED